MTDFHWPSQEVDARLKEAVINYLETTSNASSMVLDDMNSTVNTSV